MIGKSNYSAQTVERKKWNDYGKIIVTVQNRSNHLLTRP